jgi:NADH-quinone oxidoreductase subunit L
VQGSTTAMWVISTVGVFTAFMAATIGITQKDIKRIVAYSTVSQLGFMAFALGTGAWMSAIFHLMTHAFFKGLLFLGCGSVIHGMHEEQNIDKMGGLRKYMPVTFWTFMAASLANAGIVPFAGFWSKDELIAGAWTSAVFPNWGKVVAVVALISAFFTALYMFRLVFLVFFGKPRFDEKHVHPHESPLIMLIPLVLLAIPSVIIGFVGFPPDEGRFHKFLAPVFEAESTAETHAAANANNGEVASLYVLQEDETHGEEGTTEEGAEGAAAEEEHAAGGHHEISNSTKWTFAIISTIVAVSGIVVAYGAYLGGWRIVSPAAWGEKFKAQYEFLYDKWRFDELYDGLFVQPFNRLANFFWKIVDVKIIDATVNGVAYGISGLSQRLRHVQTGLVANYALAIALGMVVMVGVYLAAFSNLFR